VDLKIPIKRSDKRVRQRELARKTVQEFARSVALIVEPRSLSASLATRIQELFQPDRLVVFYLDLDRNLFSPTLTVGYSSVDVDGFFFKPNDRLIRWLQVNEACLIVPESREILEYLTTTEREALERLGVRVVVPLGSLHRLTGLILLGATDTQWQLGREEVELLETMGRQAGLALENSFLYREQQDRLQRLYRAERLAAASQLAASLAHEIRNPLAAIRSTIQYLLGDYHEGHPKRELISEVLGEVDRINRTLTGLLTLSRTHEAERVPVRLVEVLEHGLTLIATQARHQGVAIEKQFADGQLSVLGDATELRQLFLNLFLNSLQAMPSGGRLSVEAVARDMPDEARAGSKPSAFDSRVEVRVTDSGCGIPAENIEKVFDPFFTTKRDGTGLGLSICHRIVERHEGEIGIESGVGEGTTVTVRLPLLQSTD
jgi:signal transduction histidine kinase